MTSLPDICTFSKHDSSDFHSDERHNKVSEFRSGQAPSWSEASASATAAPCNRAANAEFIPNLNLVLTTMATAHVPHTISFLMQDTYIQTALLRLTRAPGSSTLASRTGATRFNFAIRLGYYCLIVSTPFGLTYLRVKKEHSLCISIP